MIEHLPVAAFPLPKVILISLDLYRLDEALLPKETPLPQLESSYHHSLSCQTQHDFLLC